MVTMLAFYSEGSSSNPSEDYKSKSCCKQMKINNDADLAHFETFGYVFVLQSDGCGFESHNPRSLWSRLNISRVDISVERTKNVLERRKLFSNIFSSWTTTKKFLEAPRERERERDGDVLSLNEVESFHYDDTVKTKTELGWMKMSDLNFV